MNYGSFNIYTKYNFKDAVNSLALHIPWITFRFNVIHHTRLPSGSILGVWDIYRIANALFPPYESTHPPSLFLNMLRISLIWVYWVLQNRKKVYQVFPCGPGEAPCPSLEVRLKNFQTFIVGAERKWEWVANTINDCILLLQTFKKIKGNYQ